MRSFAVLAVALAGTMAAATLGAQQGGTAAPRGFRGIELGMDLEEVKAKLSEDPLFDYRGDPDVSLLPQPPQTLIECAGNSFLQRAYFQFHEQKLYILILVLAPDRLDYYTLFSTLSKKYGDPASLDPSEAIWAFPGVRVSLERPVSVKYIDTEVFERLQVAGQAERDLWEISKAKFLDRF
jgi:hypothetical protein